MLRRCLSLRSLLALIALAAGCTQAPAAPATPVRPSATSPAVGFANPASAGQSGQILVAKVNGAANLMMDGITTALRADDVVPAKARISTGGDSSVVLVFSNGDTVALGAESVLELQEFQEQPSRSRTMLALNRGEMVANVTRLTYSHGSSFTVQSAVGMAFVRGGPATFRMVFRPSGTGQAFFTLSTVKGDLGFVQGAQVGAGASGYSVPAGQEIVIAVNVTRDGQGGVVVTPGGQVQPKPVAPAKGP